MTRRELHRQKFKMVSDYLDSGKTQLAFVRESGISITGFRYWLKRYRKKYDKPLKNNFIEVTSVPAIREELSFDIIFPNGVRINLPSSTDDSLLSKVIKSW
jgi:hypothetical protein